MKRALPLLFLASCVHDIDSFDRIEDVQTARDLDILYVFDNSPDRGSFNVLGGQLDALQKQLASIDGQVPNLHVGVVTTDLGTRGTLDALPAPASGRCIGDGNGGKLTRMNAGTLRDAYLEDLRGPNGSRIRNFDSDNTDDLVAELGLLTNPDTGTQNTGCEFAQPLEAMKRALDPAVNPGFIRDDAQLLVLFLTSDDDCSLKRGAMLDPNNTALGPLSYRCTEQGVMCDNDDPRTPGVKTNCKPRVDAPFTTEVADYVDFLTAFKANPADIKVSAVVGATTPFTVINAGIPVLAPSCNGPAGIAKPAVRLGALVDSFGGTLVDACTQTAGYDRVTAPLVNAQRSCFPNLRADDGENCTVVERTDEREIELERCTDDSVAPCWFTFADATACPSGENIGIAIDRRRSTAPATSQIEARCFVK